MTFFKGRVLQRHTSGTFATCHYTFAILLALLYLAATFLTFNYGLDTPGNQNLLISMKHLQYQQSSSLTRYNSNVIP